MASPSATTRPPPAAGPDDCSGAPWRRRAVRLRRAPVADCSYEDNCIGTHVSGSASGVVASAAEALQPDHLYRNGVNCTWLLANATAGGATAGAPAASCGCGCDGTSSWASTTCISVGRRPRRRASAPSRHGGRRRVAPARGAAGLAAALNFVTDLRGRRGGFVASYTIASTACDDDDDCSAPHGACVGGACVRRRPVWQRVRTGALPPRRHDGARGSGSGSALAGRGRDARTVCGLHVELAARRAARACGRAAAGAQPRPRAGRRG